MTPELELFDSGDIALIADLLMARHARRPRPVLVRHGRALRLPASAGDRALRPQPPAARTPPGPASASAASPSRPWRCPTLLAAMSASGLRTTSTCRAACSPRPTPPWSPRRAASSSTSAARSPPRSRPATCSACTTEQEPAAMTAAPPAHSSTAADATRLAPAREGGGRRPVVKLGIERLGLLDPAPRRRPGRDRQRRRQPVRRQGRDGPDALRRLAAHAGPRLRRRR